MKAAWHVTINGDFIAPKVYAYCKSVKSVLSAVQVYASNGEAVEIMGGNLKHPRKYFKGALGYTEG